MVSAPVRLAAAVLAAALCAGCAPDTGGSTVPAGADSLTALRAPAQAVPRDFPAPALRSPAGGSAGTEVSALPGIGPETLAELPADSRQVLIASTPEAGDTAARTVLWERSGDGWQQVRAFAGHNGGAGWLRDRREGDRTSPIGVFALTDAGGSLPDPGALLPYTEDPSLRSQAVTAYGADYSEVFDLVIAINYNREPGTPPDDDTRPLGWDAGGKIWLHVDHGSPTRGCITVDAADMEYLLRTLDPADRPHIIMGPVDDLAR